MPASDSVNSSFVKSEQLCGSLPSSHTIPGSHVAHLHASALVAPVTPLVVEPAAQGVFWIEHPGFSAIGISSLPEHVA